MHKPLDSPFHGHVGDDKRRSEVEDLVAESSPDVEDCSMACAGERALCVAAESVMNDTSLCWGTWKSGISRRSQFPNPVFEKWFLQSCMRPYAPWSVFRAYRNEELDLVRLCQSSGTSTPNSSQHP